MSTSEQLRASQEASTVPFYVLHNSTTIDYNPKHATITLFTLKEQDKRLLQFNKLHNATRIEYDKLKYPTSTILSSAPLLSLIIHLKVRSGVSRTQFITRLAFTVLACQQ